MLRSLLTLSVTTCKINVHRRLSEWHLTFVMLLSGLVFLFGDTFHLPPYAVVKEIATDFTWGLVMMGLGTIRLIVLYINGKWSRSPHWRSVLAALSAIVWSVMLAGLMAFSTPLLVGPFIFVAIVVELISAFRSAQDAREVDESGAPNGSTG